MLLTCLLIYAEFCDGGTLKSAIDEGRLHDVSGGGPPRPVMSCILQLAVDIAAGMAHVHSRNIVHGDLVGGVLPLKLLLCSPVGMADLRWPCKHSVFSTQQ